MEFGTVTAAAEALLRTQPQISRLIAELEQDVGFSLFFRQRRRLVPTQRGSLLYASVKRALNGLDEIDRIAEEIRSDTEAVLRILVPPYAASTVLPGALRTFIDRFPDRRFTVEIINRNSMGTWISFHPFDVGIASLPFDLPAVQTHPFATVETVAVLPAAHPLAVRPVIEMADLEGQAFIGMSRNTPMRRIVDDNAKASGIKLKIVGETATSSSACEMVARGLGLTIVDSLVPITLASPNLVFRPWKPGHKSQFGLLYPAAAKPSNAARDFAAALAETTLAMHPELVRPI